MAKYVQQYNILLLLLLLLLLGGIAERDNAAYMRQMLPSVVCPSVCMSSVTLVHLTEAVGRNEMPFGRDTRMVPSNIVLDRVPGFPRKEIWPNRCR